MQEKPFDGITVQEVLDRAGVARSTFYKHYRDKDDLFLSDVEDFFASASTMLTRTKADLRRLAPIRELFAHIAGAREFYVSLAASGMLDEAKGLGRGFFARSIEERLRLAGVQLTQAEMSPTAHALSGSMFALLDWWADHGMKMEPEGMDRLFHARAWAGISSTPSES
ncbi:AcrR family transcriptional regulator [Granulicella aggregans]|uniref:AcrR family transcriptional regulator n=2 Tax=Granulicella aggregans TaxID=474949 RepID=A0A7W8E6L0_9BACT|nr:AcrR family transcriptional regulator [Granulicella aggregans]